MKTDKQIAQEIRDYWAARGHKVNVRVVDFGRDGHGAITGIRSNMVDGLPLSLKRPRTVAAA